MTSPSGAMTDDRLREAVIAACRALAQRGLTHGTSGNVSVRRDERCFFVSPTGIPTALALGEVRILDEIEMRRVVEKFRTYGKSGAADSGLVFGGGDIPGPAVKEK